MVKGHNCMNELGSIMGHLGLYGDIMGFSVGSTKLNRHIMGL